MWNNTSIRYSFSNSKGLSGGLLTLWRERDLEVIYIFKGEGYLGINVVWKIHIYYIVNVYSSCILLKKKELWGTLLDLKEAHIDGEWIFGGDFNAVKHQSERKGRTLNDNKIGMNLFVDFIEKSNLVDIPSKGKKVSWYSRYKRFTSHIDRFLFWM